MEYVKWRTGDGDRKGRRGSVLFFKFQMWSLYGKEESTVKKIKEEAHDKKTSDLNLSESSEK